MPVMDAYRGGDLIEEIHRRDAPAMPRPGRVKFIEPARVPRPPPDGFVILLFVAAHRAIQHRGIHVAAHREDARADPAAHAVPPQPDAIGVCCS